MMQCFWCESLYLACLIIHSLSCKAPKQGHFNVNLRACRSNRESDLFFPPSVAFHPSGRGRPPPRSLKRSRRQERCSKDTAKLLLLYDDHILDNDPMRESKDFAFAQAYLNRVKECG